MTMANVYLTPKPLRKRPGLIAILRTTLGLMLGCTIMNSAAALDLPSIPWNAGVPVTPNLFLLLDDSNSMNFANQETAYIPTTRYEIPPQADGTPFPTPSITLAPNDGFAPTSGRPHRRYDLTSCTGGGPGNSVDAPRGRRGSNRDDDDNGCKTCRAASDKQNCAIWFSFYRTKILQLQSTMLVAFDNPKIFNKYNMGWRGIHNTNSWNSPGSLLGPGKLGLFDATKLREFRNWVIAINTLPKSPLRSALMRVHEYIKTKEPYLRDLNDPQSVELSCRPNFSIMVTDGKFNADDVCNQNGNEDECDILYSNADWNTINLVNSWNIPKTDLSLTSLNNHSYLRQNPYQDKSAKRLSDYAFQYWLEDARPDLANKVQPKLNLVNDEDNITGSEFWNPRNNPATWQNLVNFFVGYKLEEKLDKNNLNFNGKTYEDGLINIENGTEEWPNGKRVYDMWHAAVNSRGELYNGSSPGEFISAIDDILTKTTPTTIDLSSAGLASSSINLENDTSLFQTRFSVSKKSGELLQYKYDPTGALTQGWSTSALGIFKPSAGKYTALYNWTTDTSKILVKVNNKKNELTPLTRNALATGSVVDDLIKSRLADQASVFSIPNGATSGAQKLLEWILGDTSYEAPNPGGVFMRRKQFLGDIVHSTPVVDGGRHYGYDTAQWPNQTTAKDKYAEFFEKQKAKKTVYFGSNDGMLHALNTEDGSVRFSYMPTESFKKIGLRASRYGLPQLSNSHTAFVDGQIATHHAWNGTEWKAVLVAGMGRGGQGLFALDVTDPDSPKLLWEHFPNTHGIPGTSTFVPQDPDLGYILGEPVIAAANNGEQWIVAFGNGYNSPSNRSVLYVMDLFQGTVIKKFSTQPSPAVTTDNGMSAPALLYLPGRRLIAGYAGDLSGRLWRFDLSDLSGSAVIKFPLFVTKPGQPITSKPRIASDRASGRFIMFGTGRMLEYADPSDRTVQSVYGVTDRLVTDNTTAKISNMLQQQVTDSGTIRTITKNLASSPKPDGWYMDLPGQGERVVEAITYLPERSLALITSLLPEEADDPCNAASGKSWIMAIHPFTGGGRDEIGAQGNYGSAMKSNSLAAPTPLRISNRELRIFINEGLSGVKPADSPKPYNPRSSWQQFR